MADASPITVIAMLRAQLDALEAQLVPPTPPTPPRAYATIAEYAEHRNVSQSTVRKWLRRGMPHARVERCIRIRLADADRWADGC